MFEVVFEVVFKVVFGVLCSGIENVVRMEG